MIILPLTFFFPGLGGFGMLFFQSVQAFAMVDRWVGLRLAFFNFDELNDLLSIVALLFFLLHLFEAFDFLGDCQQFFTQD